MARSSKAPFSGGVRRRYTVNQGGAPEPATDANTTWVGKQPGTPDAPAAEQQPAAEPGT